MRRWGGLASSLFGVRLLHERHHLVVVTANPVGYGQPRAALHLIDPQIAAALVILRRDVKRRTQSLQVEFADGLVSPAHVVAGEWQAVALDREPNPFQDDRAGKDAAVVVRAAHV